MLDTEIRAEKLFIPLPRTEQEAITYARASKLGQPLGETALRSPNEITNPLSPERLSEKILDPSLLPDVQVDDDKTPISVQVTSNKTLHINGVDIPLSAHEVFALNTLLLTRGRHVSARELREYGFGLQRRRGVSTSTFNRAIAGVSEKLNDTAGCTVIQRTGVRATMRYAVSEQLSIELSPDEKRARRHAEQIPNDILDQEDSPEEDTVQTERQKIIAETLEAVGKYKDHHKVLAKLHAARAQDLDLPPAHLSAEERFTWIGAQYTTLNAEQEVHLGALIQTGMAAYRSLDHSGAPSPEQEKALIDMAYAFEHMFLANHRLVFSIAQRYKWMLPLPDALQFGSNGLIEAVCLSNPSLGYKFSTYAWDTIHGSINRGAANMARDIRLPMHLHDAWRKILRTQVTLASDLGYTPTIEQIADACDMEAPQVQDILRHGVLSRPSLDQPINDEGTPLGEFVSSPSNPEDETTRSLNASSRLGTLQLIMKEAGLDARQMAIVGLRSGLPPDTFEIPPVKIIDKSLPYASQRHLTYPELLAEIAQDQNIVLYDKGFTLEAIGGALGLTRERIRQIESKAMKQMRDAAPRIPGIGRRL